MIWMKVSRVGVYIFEKKIETDGICNGDSYK